MSAAPVARRSFLARLSAAAAVLAGTTVVPRLAHAEPTSLAPDALDSWFAGMKAANKSFYDAPSPPSAPNAVLFARNLLHFSNAKLGTKDGDFSIVIGFRHFGTPFGYNDAIWAKYPELAKMIEVDDPATKARAVRNWMMHGQVEDIPGCDLPGLQKRGVQFTVCGAATEYIAGVLAGPKGDAKAVEAELVANLIPGARVVPAGVVAVQRAQKNGFAYTFSG